MSPFLIKLNNKNFARKVFNCFFFSLVALTAISEVIIQFNLLAVKQNAKVINVAGRQRMLSQKLVKEIYFFKDNLEDSSRFKEILEIHRELITNHRALMHGSEELRKAFSNDIYTKYQRLSSILTKLEGELDCLTHKCRPLGEIVRDLDHNMILFLERMDGIVLDLENYSRREVELLSFVANIIFALTLFLIIFGFYRYLLPIKTKLAQLKEELDEVALVSKTNLEGVITYANEKFCEVSGYNLQELIGQPHSIVNSGLHSAEFWTKVWSTIKNGDIWKGEICNQTKNGKTYWVETTILPCKDLNGKMIGYTSIRIDITEKKLNEKKMFHQSKLASLGELAASVGHEINNPLAIVAGNLELAKGLIAKEIVQNESLSKYLAKIEEATKRIQIIVKGLKVYSRMDSDKEEVISLTNTVTKTKDLLEDIYKKAGIEIITDGLEADYYIRANSGRIQQILMNLISNAKDATEGNNSRLIKISLSTNSDKKVILTVSDNGVGIPEHIRDRILEPFFTTKEVGKGTGMGLGITNELVQKMNGQLKVDSKLGHGSSFHIELPMVNSI